MALITLNKRSGGFWNCQKIRKKPPEDTSPICSTTASQLAKNPAPIAARYMNGSTIHAANSRVAHKNVIPLIPITSSASISSEIRIDPNSATIPVPTFAAIMYPNASGTISRRSHHAANTPEYAGAPIERLKYAPSIPHSNPEMNTSPQITNVEPTIKIPAWRNASPKNLNTRRPKISRNTCAMNLTNSPKFSTQPRGTATSSPI